MARPVKWSRDVHAIRDRATRSRTETWSRQAIERLFGVGRASAQTLMKAIGDVQAVGGTHFVDRGSLLAFLDSVSKADSVEEAMRVRLEQAAPVMRPAPLFHALPAELRRVTLADLPPNVEIREGEVRITGADAAAVVEGLLLLAQVMQNDLDAVRHRLDPPPTLLDVDRGLQELLAQVRRNAAKDLAGNEDEAKTARPHNPSLEG